MLSKIVGQLGIIFLLSISVIAYGQEQKKVNIETKGKTTLEVLQSIEAQTGFQFFYIKSQLDLIPKPEYKFSNATVDDVLDVLLKDTDISYEIVANHIVFKKKPIPIFSVQGNVKDEAGEPLIGAYIKVKNQNISVLADSTGAFELKMQKGSVVVISYTGFQEKEIPINNSQTLKIKLNYEKGNLNEVVVVGYGTQKRKNITGAVSSIEGKELQSIPVTSFQSAIQGRVAGVHIINNSGNPAGEVYVRIRGNASLIGENKPLYVVDGVPVLSGHYYHQALGLSGGQDISILSDINPADIASVEFLKDASATAIYGSRGGNGVVLITTKKSTGGKLSFKYNTYTGIQQNTKRYKLLDADQYAAYSREAIQNGGSGTAPPISGTGYNTDWQNRIFRNAPITSHLLSLSKGDSIIRLYMSLGYFNQAGVIINNNYSRGNVKLNFDHKIRKWKVGLNLLTSLSSNNRVLEGTSAEGVLSSALLRNPSLGVREPDGNYTDDPAGIENPLRAANDVKFNIGEKRIIGSIYGEYVINKNLRLRTSLSLDHVGIVENLNLPSSLQSLQYRTISFHSKGRENLIINENTLSYDKRAGAHAFSLLGGLALQQSHYKSLSEYSIKNINPANNSSDIQNLNSADVLWKMSSIFAKANYAYKEKYLLNINSRLDRTSRLGGSTAGIFPSAAVGWRISKEDFFKDIPLFSEIKLRLSHGASGNQDVVRTYDRKGRVVSAAGTDMDPNEYNRLPDANLKWERVVQTNGGIDIGLFNNRISFTGDVYVKICKNLLTIQQIPLDSGKVAVGRNTGSIHTRGLELNLNSLNTNGRFKWRTNFNISFIKNKVNYFNQYLPNDSTGSILIEEQNVGNGETIGKSYNIYKAGEDFGSFYGYVFEGVDPATGMARYADLDSDGKLTERDRTIIGSPMPKHFGGLTNNFSYGPFELDIFFQWSYGNKIFNMTRQILNNSDLADKGNASEEQLQRWKNSGDITDVPVAETSSNTQFLASSRWVEDGSYLRLKKITLSFHGRSLFSKNKGLKDITIYVSASNLLTFTNYMGLDPESQNQYSKDNQLGIDTFTQPTPRTFLIGLNVGF